MEDHSLAKISASIHRSNGKLYRVGGAVRDAQITFILNAGQNSIIPKDNDYCVTGLSEEQFISLFPFANKTGESFPVFRIKVDGEECEFALARRERKMEGSLGHTSFIVETSASIRIEDDLSRRDLTMNAMAIRISENGSDAELIDPFGGREDIARGVVSAIFTPHHTPCEAPFIDESGIYYKENQKSNFTEDPLRVYRAIRFACKFGYQIDIHTKEMMAMMGAEVASLSAERVYDELCKVIQTTCPSTFWLTLQEVGLLSIHFPIFDREMVDFFVLDERTEGTVAERISLMFSQQDPEKVKRMLDALKAPTLVRDQAFFIAANLERLLHFEQLDAEEVIDFINRTQRHPLTKQVESAEPKTDHNPIAWLLSTLDLVLNIQGIGHSSEGLISKLNEVYQRVTSLKVTPPPHLSGKEIGAYINQAKQEHIKKLLSI